MRQTKATVILGERCNLLVLRLRMCQAITCPTVQTTGLEGIANN